MNRWLERLLILSEIGGGFLGIALVARDFSVSEKNMVFMIVNAAFAVVFLLGIIAGFALIESPQRGVVLSGLYQALQIPSFVFYSVEYHFGSGFVGMIYFSKTGVDTSFYLDARYSLYLSSNAPFYFGLNLIALLLFVYLLIMDRRLLRRKRTKLPEDASGGAPDLWASPIRRKLSSDDDRTLQ